ncbi:MAG: hypothetical protein ACTHKS_09280 [Gaiellaceae bacterium]
MRCAIVGSGLAALASYATLRHAGVRPEEITVFGTHADPTEAWRVRAASIRQERMRSESDGHLAAASFPGLAVREGSLRALAQTVTSRYRPPVDLFLAHADEVRAQTRWDESFVERRAATVRVADGGFAIDGDGPFAHVLLALGHPGLARLPGTVHAYEPHEYATQVAVIGAGMAAATEWRNALAAGSEVVSIRRREPLRRPLNIPRAYFSKRRLDSFHRLEPRPRAALLEDLSHPSYPPGRAWDVDVTVVDDPPPGFQVIAATGFRRGWHEDPLLVDLVAAHGLETQGRWLVLAPDSTVPGLTDDGRTLSVAGVAGQWAFPAADTIAGAKYSARAFAHRVCRTR